MALNLWDMLLKIGENHMDINEVSTGNNIILKYYKYSGNFVEFYCENIVIK